MTSEQRSPTDPGGRAARYRQRRLAAAGGAAIIAGGVTGGIVLSTRGPDLSTVHYSAMVPQAQSAPGTGQVLIPPPIVLPAPALAPPLAAQSLQSRQSGQPVQQPSTPVAPVTAAAVPPPPPAGVAGPPPPRRPAPPPPGPHPAGATRG